MPIPILIFNFIYLLALFLKRPRKLPFSLDFFLIIIGIFYPSSEPISPHLLRCGPLAVDETTASWTDALHLRQPRLVNNPCSPELFIKNVATFYYFICICNNNDYIFFSLFSSSQPEILLYPGRLLKMQSECRIIQ